MVEVFFRHLGDQDTPERQAMTAQTYSRWFGLPVTLRFLTPTFLSCTVYAFQRLSRIVADALAQNDFYILADSDMLPETDYNPRAHIDALREHSSFAILSAWPTNCNIYTWTPEGYETYPHEHIMEHVSVGGLRACRKGVMIDWPEQTATGYDNDQCIALRAIGYRSGYFLPARAIHLGQNKSSIPAQ